MLNTARIPVPDCVEYLVRMLQSPAFRETWQSQMMLMDELVLRRVRSALEQRFGGGADLIKAQVTAGRLFLPVPQPMSA